MEEHFPARVPYPALLRHLNEISTLLESGPPEIQRRRVTGTAGESAVLAAWFAWELGDGPDAAGNSRLAGLAAKRADDAAVVSACMASYRTYMTDGDNRRGVRLATDGLEHLGSADPATRAWLLARQAEEATLLGDRAHADPGSGEPIPLG
ncbi:hypothetical protein [Rhizohabitans arisaemae]|uniref:hypothetical protein n=1 Tax=Rhizohabitans arisaemae TaxID=2720610 RepID=UPI0024B27869|nr:hypothetical protein [Rhizohabitans arisaemae]